MKTLISTARASLLAAIAAVALSWCGGHAAEKEECPLKWHTSVKKAVAAAKAANRPILMVFGQSGTGSHGWFEGTRKTVEGKTYWTAVPPVRHANVILAKILPPPRLKLPAGTPADQVRTYEQARKKLLDRYNQTARKYAVLRLPTVLFLSPDGETVFKTFTRKTEAVVLGSLRHLPHFFHHYREVQALARKQDLSKLDAAVPTGSGDISGTWHASLSSGIAEAGKKDRPVVLVFTASSSGSTDWFGHTQSALDGSLEWSALKELQIAGATLVKLAPPTQLRMNSKAPYQQVGQLRNALAKQRDAYAKLARKYAVTRIPAVRFLSPDGKVVFKSYNRKTQSIVLKGLKLLPKLFADYKKMREMIKEAGGK